MSYPPPQPPQYPYYQQPPVWQPPPYVPPDQLRPRRVWYWLSAIPAIVGVALAVVFIVMLVNRIDVSLDHFSAGSSRTVHVEGGKERGIYIQTGGTRAAFGGVSSCAVREAGGDVALPVHNVNGSFTLDINGNSYRELYWFKAPSTGDYTVSCQGAEGTPLSIGPHFGFSGLAIPIVGTVLSLLIGIGLTITIAVVTAVRRSNHKKRIQQQILAGAAPPPTLR